MKTFVSLFLAITLLASCKKDRPIDITLADFYRSSITFNWCNDTIYCWGDSFSVNGVGNQVGYPEQLSQFTGIVTVNKGISGQSAVHVRNRFLAEPSTWKNAHIFWAGRNDSWGDTARTIQNIQDMVDKLPHQKYIVIGILNGDLPEEYKGDTTKVWGGMMQHYYQGFNRHLAERFPGHYLEPLPLLQAAATSSYEDQLAISRNITPPIVRVDFLHLNTLGNGIIAGGIAGMLTPCNTQLK